MGSTYPIAQINTMFICLFSISHSYCKNILYLQTLEGLGVITFSQTEAPLFYSVSQCCKMQIKNLPASNLVLKLPSSIITSSQDGEKQTVEISTTITVFEAIP